jgi:hypothetical protein
MSRTFPTCGSSTHRLDWLADDAVQCEPVSAPNSLLTGKITGKFAKLGPSQLLHCLVASEFRPLWPNFPKQSNREFGRENREAITQNREVIRPQVDPSPAQIKSGSAAGAERRDLELSWRRSPIRQCGRKPTATSALSHKRSGSRSPAATSVTMRRAMACRTLSGPRS